MLYMKDEELRRLFAGLLKDADLENDSTSTSVIDQVFTLHFFISYLFHFPFYYSDFESIRSFVHFWNIQFVKL